MESKATFDSMAESIKNIIREMPPDMIHERFYNVFSNVCLLLIGYMNANGEKGWSARLHTPTGQEMLSKKEQDAIEGSFASAPWLLRMLKEVKDGSSASASKQTGGGGFAAKAAGIKHDFMSGSFIDKEIPLGSLPTLSVEDMSLDVMFEKFLDKITEIDAYWSDFATKTPGFAKKINEMPDIITPPVPPLGIPPIPISPKFIVTVLITLIDSIRLSLALTNSGGPRLRVALTLLVLIEELATGQWRQMIFTSVGLFTGSGLALSIIMKYIVNVLTLINPELRTALAKDIYKSTKSLVFGFLLWAATTLPPNITKRAIRKSFDSVQEVVAQLQARQAAIEDKANEVLVPKGYSMRLAGLDLNKISAITIEDIQNLQVLATWPLIICTQEIQLILAPLIAVPISRLLLELLGIPTTASDKFTVCGAEPYNTLTQEIIEAAEPIVEPLEGLQEVDQPESNAAPSVEPVPEANLAPSTPAPSPTPAPTSDPDPSSTPDPTPAVPTPDPTPAIPTPDPTPASTAPLTEPDSTTNPLLQKPLVKVQAITNSVTQVKNAAKDKFTKAKEQVSDLKATAQEHMATAKGHMATAKQHVTDIKQHMAAGKQHLVTAKKAFSNPAAAAKSALKSFLHGGSQEKRKTRRIKSR